MEGNWEGRAEVVVCPRQIKEEEERKPRFDLEMHCSFEKLKEVG